MCNPKTGSPTITLCQLRPNHHFVFNLPKGYTLSNLRTLNKGVRNKLRPSTEAESVNALCSPRYSLEPTQLFGRDGRCVQSLIDHSP
jgi:hypothetical protein